MPDPRHRDAPDSAQEAAGRPVVETADIALAGFFHAHGLDFLGAMQDGARELFFRFADPEFRRFQLAIDFVNSPEARFDASIRFLKKVGRSEYGPGVFRPRGGRHPGSRRGNGA